MTDHTLDVPKYQGDVTNRCAVSVDRNCIIQLNPGAAISMTKEQALVHAAWLVVLADQSKNFEEFRRVLKAVLES